MFRPACPRTTPRCPPLRSGARGFTLVELMVTLSLVVVVTLVLLPGMADFNARNRISALEGDLLSAVALARSEAARNGVPVLLVAASGGVTGNAYAGGWSLVLDSDGDGTADASETVLRVREALSGDLKLDGSSSITFGATGFLSPASAVTLTICRRDGNTRGVTVTITPSGQTDSTAITTCS
ncbi:GspH/FimT family pseudopilin [Sphaerotilus microaerophilus]|uniref:Type II secretion system protein H n=1 Tax=Sphaerotilus microaerophilus TaxID=2914710 RepID=A0ABM7YJN5_9BURK|nr:GspH/FimT family protein [Sphaerotilus sp. FB-5]BDI04530.1 hypothetical protein CATMQ487_15000 [Sphaerotilus sp. FB-5]